MTTAVAKKPDKILEHCKWPMRRVRYSNQRLWVPIIDKPYTKILALVESEGYAFDMCEWIYKSTETGITYVCNGGAIIVVAGKQGDALASGFSDLFTAPRLILKNSSPLPIPAFNVEAYDVFDPELATQLAMTHLRELVRLERDR